MTKSAATFEELHGDVTHEDWCSLDDPSLCEGECQRIAGY